MTNMLEIIYYSKTTWLGIQVVFDTCSRFTFIFCRKFLKKHRVLNIQDGCFQFSILKKIRKVDKLMIRKKISFSIPPTSQPVETRPSCGHAGQAHVLAFSPFSALCSREHHQALPGEVVWRQPSQGSVRSMQSCIDRPGRWQKQLSKKSCCWSFLSCFQSLVSQQKTELKVCSKVADLIW